jgi:hypothetical protein
MKDFDIFKYKFYLYFTEKSFKFRISAVRKKKDFPSLLFIYVRVANVLFLIGT